MNNHIPQLKPVRFTNNNKPPVWEKPLTRWQRLTCKHRILEPVYTSLDQEAGHYHAHLVYYICINCGRKRYTRRKRVNPLVPLMLIALAVLITYWFWF